MDHLDWKEQMGPKLPKWTKLDWMTKVDWNGSKYYTDVARQEYNNNKYYTSHFRNYINYPV